MEEVLPLRHDAVNECREVDLCHIRLALGHLGGELAPEVVDLSIVIDEDGRTSISPP